MKIPRMVGSRSVPVLAAATCLVLVVGSLLTGCGSDEPEEYISDKIDAENKAKRAVASPDKTTPEVAETRLEGTWTWNQKKIVSINNGAIQWSDPGEKVTVTIIKQSNTSFRMGPPFSDATVICSAKTFVEIIGEGFRYSGGLNGNRIDGKLEFDLGKGSIQTPWHATRVK